MTEDPVVILAVYGLYGLGLLGLYGVVCLVEWAGRTLGGIDWEALWKRGWPAPPQIKNWGPPTEKP